MSSADPRLDRTASLVLIAFYATPVVFPVMGSLILQRRPYTKVAWLMVGLGLSVGFGILSYAYGVVGYPPGPYAPLPFALVALVISQMFFIPAIAGATTWILLLYPTDHLLGPRWAWVGWGSIAISATFVIGSMLTPGLVDKEALPGLMNPLGLTGELGATMQIVGEAAQVLALLGPALGALSLVLRYRRADAVVAAQIRWLALVTVLAV